MATVTWTGAGADNLASTGLNWDTGTAPASGNDVLFDGAFPVTGSKNVTFDITTALNKITASSGYTGTITQTSACNITSGAVLSFTFDASGTWNSNGQALTIAEGTGPSFDASGSATKTLTFGASVVSVAGTLNLSGANLTFNYNTSEVKITSSATVTTKSGVEFYKFTGNGATTITFGSDVIVNNTFDMAALGGQKTFNGNKVFCKGNLIKSFVGGTSGTDGTTVFEFSGIANQTWSWNTSTGTISNNIIINKSGGTLTFGSDSIRLDGAFTYTAGTVDTSTNSSTVIYQGGNNVNGGTMSFYNFQLATGSVTLTGNFNVSNNFNIGDGIGSGGSATLNGSSRTITVNGNWTLNTTDGAFIEGTSTVIFNGTSTVAGATTFNNLTINSGKTVHLTSTQTFTVSGAFTTLGTSTLDATTGGSRANLNVNGSQSVVGVTATDIDSSGGSVKPIHNIGGTNSNTVEWDTDLQISITDAITVSESINLTQVYNINVNDNISITESIESLYELIIVSESINLTQVYNINVSDSITVSESVTTSNPLDSTSISDSITITEDININVINSDININVSDSITITEDIITRIDENINVSDSITITEDIITRIDENINVNDPITITENVNVKTELNIDKNETITVSEAITFLVDENINVNDSVTIGESATPLQIKNVNKNDTVTITESTSTVVYHEFYMLAVGTEVLTFPELESEDIVV